MLSRQEWLGESSDKQDDIEEQSDIEKQNEDDNQKPICQIEKKQIHVKMICIDSYFEGYTLMLPDYNLWIEIANKLGIVAFVDDLFVPETNYWSKITLPKLIGELVGQIRNQPIKEIDMGGSLMFRKQAQILLLLKESDLENDLDRLKLALLDYIKKSITNE